MGLGTKIGGLSLNKIVDVAQVAELALKTSVPATNLLTGAKIAEHLLSGDLLKASLERKFAEVVRTPLAPLDPKNLLGIE